MTAFILTAALTIAAPVPKGAEDRLAKDVSAARQKAVDFLKKKQAKDGTWEGVVLTVLADMDGGTTALVTLSFLEAGVPANDPVIEKAVAYLAKLEPKRTYVVSLQTQVLGRVDAKKYKELIQRNVDWLLEKSITKGDELVGWSYPAQQIADGSNTHFAVMALHAAATAGAKVDAKAWQQVREMYARTQSKSGWGYYSDRAFGGERTTSSMTTCALLGLTIAVKYDKKAKGPDPAFEKGMPQLLTLADSSKAQGYAWFATAELGRALGQIEFKAGEKTRAWYRDGAEKLIKGQQADGSFAISKVGIDGNETLSTAFGLYFLGPPPKQ